MSSHWSEWGGQIFHAVEVALIWTLGLVWFSLPVAIYSSAAAWTLKEGSDVAGYTHNFGLSTAIYMSKIDIIVGYSTIAFLSLVTLFV